jgi:hypothetical protein
MRYTRPKCGWSVAVHQSSFTPGNRQVRNSVVDAAAHGGHSAYQSSG